MGGWEVRVDRSVGDGCFAMQVFERGTIVRIGFDAANQRIYLFSGHPDRKSLEEGKLYPVRVLFDGGKAYNGELRGQRLGNTIFLAHRELSAEFVRDFMQRNGMGVFYRSARIANLSLRNTYAAVSEVMNCQREFGTAAAPRRSDPFASSPEPRSGRDPFR